MADPRIGTAACMPGDELDQIAVDRNRSPRFTDRVNLVATMEFERIHAFDRDRIAVPIKRDPLWTSLRRAQKFPGAFRLARKYAVKA